MSKVDKFMELIRARVQGSHEVRADRVHEKLEEVLEVEDPLEFEEEREKRRVHKQKQRARARRVRPVTRRK